MGTIRAGLLILPFGMKAIFDITFSYSLKIISKVLKSPFSSLMCFPKPDKWESKWYMVKQKYASKTTGGGQVWFQTLENAGTCWTKRLYCIYGRNTQNAPKRLKRTCKSAVKCRLTSVVCEVHKTFLSIVSPLPGLSNGCGHPLRFPVTEIHMKAVSLELFNLCSILVIFAKICWE